MTDEQLIALARAWRDEAQRRRIQAILTDRLADDREPEECRTLLRLAWQCAMSYREITAARIEATVSARKREVLEGLFAALEAGHDAIDRWAEEAEATLPPVADLTFLLRAAGRHATDES